ncbi:hypothetical protein PENARI_c051G01122 [Penicillium arizonense]|uniref:AMP-dependent synthetase/ligase domain-containing protein n=1 Tax=Penicillium arizonense TaxID=1835702 RepID=A0A1F5L2Y4_PENAI|nr:hypothetical protein PENARI_c051G01122 [Penicillium arizonense]OGE47291.1 hypothetical protein PENARI_c051G01122 [Penicillium arizonense]
MAGGIFTGCNPAYSSHELAHQMRDCDPKFILSQGGSTLQTCLEAARMVGSGHEKRTFVFDDRVFDSVEQPDEQGCPYWSKLMLFDTEAERFAWDSLTGPDEARKTTLALNYSSGTTGLSKGVEITHGNYVANVVQYNHLMAHDRDYDAKHRQNERYLCFLPLYHAMAQMLFLGVAQIRHAPVYIMEKFDFLRVLQSVEIYRISDLLIVPPVAVMLAKRPETKKFDLSSVRYIGSGAAPLSRELSQEVEDLWPQGTINIKQGWGMTELTCALLGWEHTKTSYSNSVGWPLPNSQAKIMSLPDEAADSDNLLLRKELGPNEPGELWVRGPQVMKGYWKNPKATADTLTPDGWVRTGDIAYYDNEQKFFISGRLKELIKVKGLQVAPTELDGACLECKEVADAAVVGVTINDQEHPL